MFSLTTTISIGLACLFALIAFWFGKRYFAFKKEANQLKQKLSRLAKKHKQKKPQSAEPQFEQILELISGGVIVSDREGHLIWHNQEAAEILDLGSPGTSKGSIMSVLSQLPMLISNSIGEPEVAPAEFDLNGRRIQGTMFVLYGKNGLDQGTVAILNDVTTWYAALRSKQKQLDEINHELRQRLTSMGSFTEMLEIDEGGDQPWLPRLHETVGRVTELIETIMQISAVKSEGDAVSHTAVDVAQTIQETIEWLKPELDEKQIYFKHQIDPDLRPIMAQPVHIQTILKELLTNSIQFNRPGGMIQIKAVTQLDEDSKMEFLILNIADDGEGIATEDQKKIFDVFYRPNAAVQSTERNIGVGLAIVHAIVEAYNGRIWFKSEKNVGTTFTILLPTGHIPSESETEEDEFAWIKE